MANAARTSYAQGWKLYPFSMAGHHLQGAAAAVAVIYVATTPAIVAALVWTGLYVAYQGLSVLRKSDSPGLDIADYMAGFVVGTAGAVAVPMLVPGWDG